MLFHKTWADYNQHGMSRAHSKLECCTSSLETASASASALFETRGAGLALQLARRIAASRTRAEGERPLAGAVSFYRTSVDHNQRDKAREQCKLECRSFSPETASAGAPALRETRGAGLALEAKAGGCRWHVALRARAEKERPLASAMSLLRMSRAQPARPAARAAASLSAASSPQRQRAPACVCRARHAAPAWRWRSQLARRTTGAR